MICPCSYHLVYPVNPVEILPHFINSDKIFIASSTSSSVLKK